MTGRRYSVREGARPLKQMPRVLIKPGSIPRLNDLPEQVLYRYRGNGADMLTAWTAETAPPRPAPRRDPEAVAVTIAMARLCGACLDGCEADCQGGSCPCACQDEPLRCEACGYLHTAIGHLAACGHAS